MKFKEGQDAPASCSTDAGRERHVLCSADRVERAAGAKLLPARDSPWAGMKKKATPGIKSIINNDDRDGRPQKGSDFPNPGQSKNVHDWHEEGQGPEPARAAEGRTRACQSKEGDLGGLRDLGLVDSIPWLLIMTPE